MSATARPATVGGTGNPMNPPIGTVSITTTAVETLYSGGGETVGQFIDKVLADRQRPGNHVDKVLVEFNDK